MAAKKKTAKKKTAAKKAPAKKKPAAKKAAATTTKAVRITAAAQRRTKTEIMTLCAEHAGISKKQAASVFDTMQVILAKDLSKKGPGKVSIPGLMNVVVKNKPATKARKGVNPFTGEEQMFKAKPASRQVKARPVKALKDLV
jgi:nucleoid DNA-binding protein